MLAHVLLAAATALSPPTTTARREFLCHTAAAATTFVALQPLSAAAEVDCLSDCLSNCRRLAAGSQEYCRTSCSDYCAQDDRKDGLSGSVSTEGAEFGFASSFKNPFAPQKPTVYGADTPPGLPDVFGVNKALRKAVTGGDLTGGVEGQGGARDFSDAAATGLFNDPTRFKAK